MPSAILEREDSPLPGWCPHTGHPGVSHGSEASVAVLGPFWIKPAPQACLPSPEQASLSAPSPCLAPPPPPAHCCPSSFISAPPPTLKSQFLWWLVGGGDAGKGHQPILPHPCHPNLPLAWRSHRGVIAYPTAGVLRGCGWAAWLIVEEPWWRGSGA